jgi:DNA repair photolyase
MQRFHPHAEPWGGFVDVKINAEEVLARQLKKLKAGEVFTCSACEGWQPLEGDYQLTRRCCHRLLEAGFRLNILTKNKLILRDIELFAGRDVCLGVTITVPEESFARLWEPGASSVSDRLEILVQAKAAGLKTAVMFGPLLPRISDTPQALERLFALVARAEVDRIWTDALNPRPRVWASIQAFLRRHRSDLLDHYRRVLFDAPFRKEYLRQLDEEVRRAAAAAGVAARLC